MYTTLGQSRIIDRQQRSEARSLAEVGGVGVLPHEAAGNARVQVSRAYADIKHRFHRGTSVSSKVAKHEGSPRGRE